MHSIAIFSGTTIPVLEQVINFAEARHNVLAGNIANMDTPGYRVRDLSPEMFHERLKRAIKEEKTGGAPLSSSGRSRENLNSLSKVGENLEGILYHDDSNVSIEQQVAEMSKNQAKHNIALAIMSSQFRLLEAAISERP